MKRVKKKPVITANLTLGETTVDNPMFSRDHPASRSNPRQIKAILNHGESPIAAMYHRKEQTGIDEIDVRTAGEFRRLFEAAAGGSFGSSGDIKEFVDGGGYPDILTDRQARAAKDLAAVHVHLGSVTYAAVERVCGQCLFINQIDTRRRTQDAISEQLKAGLKKLAIYWGFRTDNRRKRA